MFFDVCCIKKNLFFHIDRLRTPAMPPRWKDEEKGRISSVARARARARRGNVLSTSRPVNRCKKLIKSQEKTRENPAKTNVFQELRSQNPVNTNSFCFPEVQKRSKTMLFTQFSALGDEKTP